LHEKEFEMSPTRNDDVTSALGGLLGALLGGNPKVKDHIDQTGQSLDEVLGTLSGGPAASGGQEVPAGTDVLGSILGSVLGGGMSQGGAPQGRSLPSQGRSQPTQDAGGDVLGSILGSILGGGGQQGGMQSQGGSGDVLGSILGSVLGGAMQQGGTPMPSQQIPSRSKPMPSQQMPGGGSDPISSILGGLLGTDMSGGVGAVANNPITNIFVQPIADALAKKTGMAPGIARVVVVFALTTLMGALTGKGSKKGFNSADLVTQLKESGTVSQSYLKSSGLVTELAQQSGLDQATAAKSLQQAFVALGTQMGDGTMEERQAKLKTTLKKFK
jgi:hypothetical protein